MKVVQFPAPDIKKFFHDIAREVEKGETPVPPKAAFVIFVGEDGELAPTSYNMKRREAVAALEVVKHMVIKESWE